MRSVVAVLATLACVLAVVAAASVPSSEAPVSDVVSLSATSFDSTLQNNENVFVKFFAPWCGHCKAMAEDYKKVATELKGEAVMAEVDCTVESSLCERYGVRGYPTLKLFRKGDFAADYKGARTKDALVKYMRRAMQPAVTAVTSSAELEALLEQNRNSPLVVMRADAGSADAALLEGVAREVAEHLADAKFVTVPSASLFEAAAAGATQGDIASSNVVVRVPAAAPTLITVDSGTTAATLLKSVLTAILPPVAVFGSENAMLYSKLGLPLLLTFVSDTAVIPTELASVAEATRGRLAVVVMDAGKYARFVEHLGLKDAPLPATVVHRMNEDVTFKPAAGQSVADFATAYLAGKVPVWIKSEPEPAHDDAAVRTVVGSSWDRIVMNPDHDVLIEQYAPWCGHCKNLAPIYEDLASSLKSVAPQLVIAKMDATKNDAPAEYKARSFPTLHFFPAGSNKKGIQYQGGRTKEAFVRFLAEHATHKFDTASLLSGDIAADASGHDEL